MKLDWRIVFMGLPRRQFTAAELQRAIPEPPGLSMRVAVVLNLAVLIGVFILAFRSTRPLVLLGVMLPFAIGLAFALQGAWRDPSRSWVRHAYHFGPIVLALALTALARPLALDREAVFAIAAVAVAGLLVLWFAIVYRHNHVELRLRELGERDRAVAMARQLAAAQIQPHFLFNSLASLQHWVQTRDDRAAPMLDALTGFLRATLPLFERERLSLGDEALAVQRYLQVMQLRLGERLTYTLDIEPQAAALPVPPGLLLTLVENAIEHGVQPALRGASVAVSAHVERGRVIVEVRDDGAGLDTTAGDGVGLANCRLRLTQAWGDDASVSLHGAVGAGCTARIEFPLPTPGTEPKANPT